MRRWGQWAIAAAIVAIAPVVSGEPPVSPDTQPPGIYVEPAAGGDGQKVEKLPSSRPARTATKDLVKGMVKGAFTGGLLGGGPKLVLVFSGERSATRLPDQPMFQFHFDPKASATPPSGPRSMADMMAMMEQANPGPAAADMPPGVARPQQFALVRLFGKGEERELEASMDMKPNRKHTVACRVRQLGPHVFRVAPEKPLPPGEYGFVAVTDAASGGMDRLWDFGVDASAAASAR